MHAWHSAFNTAHVHETLCEVDLVPRQQAHFARTQTMPKRNEDHRRIAQPVPAALARAVDQSLDFFWREVLARPRSGIEPPLRRNCAQNDGWALAPIGFFIQ